MHLREVILRNWRSYRSAHFRLPEPKGKKRVILIGAMNGNGKTSLLMALYLGLFGREAMSYIEGVRLGTKNEEQSRSYKLLMRQILHRPALGDTDPHASVELRFASGEQEEQNVTVGRTWHYRRGGDLRDPETQDGEEVRVEVDGQLQAVRGWQQANNLIGDLLFPAHVTPCFFFDGEQAQARVESAGGRALSDAVTTLFGTGVLNELSNTLRTYINQKQSQIRPEAAGYREDGLADRRRRLDALECELAGVTVTLDAARKTHEGAEEARRGKMTELHQVVGDTAIDLKRLAQQRTDLQKREGDIQRDFRDGLTGVALPIALRKLGGRVAERLKAEMVRDKWLILRDDATAKAEEIVADALPADGTGVLPPLTGPQHEQLTSRFKAALQMLWTPPPTGCAADYRYTFLNSADRMTASAQLHSALRSSGQDVARLATEWNAARTRRAELDRTWDAVSDQRPKVERLKQDMDELDATIRELSGERIRLETAQAQLQTEAGELRGAIGQMEAKKRDLDPVTGKLDLAQRVQDVINGTRDRLVPLCRSAVQDRCTHHFRQMISGEYQNYRVEFDEDYQPVLVGDGQPVYVTTLSGAQKRAFGLAFTLAIADATGAEAPLVIDTPVGNMDSEYRGRILTYLAKAAPGQVIFLSHDEEIAGAYTEQLRPYTVGEFLVTFDRVGDGVGVSTVVADRYFA